MHLFFLVIHVYYFLVYAFKKDRERDVEIHRTSDHTLPADDIDNSHATYLP